MSSEQLYQPVEGYNNNNNTYYPPPDNQHQQPYAQQPYPHHQPQQQQQHYYHQQQYQQPQQQHPQPQQPQPQQAAPYGSGSAPYGSGSAPYGSGAYESGDVPYGTMTDGAGGMLGVQDRGQKFAAAETSPYRDGIWGVLFVLHFIGMIVLAVVMTQKYKADIEKGIDHSDLHVGKKFWEQVGLLLVSGAAVAACWLLLIKHFANTLIWACIGMGIALMVAFSLFLFSIHATAFGVIMIVMILIQLLYVYLIRHRIAFATAMLEVVVRVMETFPAPVVVAFVGVIAQAVWFIIWAVGAVSTLYGEQKNHNSHQGLTVFLLLVSFYWSSQVIKNVVHTSSAGTAATWYFQAPHNIPPNPTLAAVRRSLTTSFGSIALGSLIIAVIRAMYQTVRMMRRNRNVVLRACALCFLSCLEQLVRYFNTYAFTYVAVYGQSYCNAAKSTWDLLKNRGLDAIVNDDIIGNVLMFGCLAGGAVTAGIGGLSAKYMLHLPDWGAWAIAGFFIGFVMALCAMEVVHSSVTAIFVCYADDPAALRDTKRDEYDTLTSAFRTFYGERLLNN